MNQHCGKNRQLTPSNFSKELVLRYNLGPLHILEKSLISEVLDRQIGTEFIRKETSVNRVVSKDLETSAAVNTYQQKQEEKTALPLSFWLKK